MESIWILFQLLSSLVVALASAIVFETFRRKHNHSCHVEAPPVFEDPNSLKPVKCPHILDPAEKYISLIVPAFNEEYRLPGALNETLNYLQERSAKDKSFSYEVHSPDGVKVPLLNYIVY